MAGVGLGVGQEMRKKNRTNYNNIMIVADLNGTRAASKMRDGDASTRLKVPLSQGEQKLMKAK